MNALLATALVTIATAAASQNMTVCKTLCSGDCKTYEPPLDACYNPAALWPGDPQWGRAMDRVLDRCNATHLSRSFFAATDVNCQTRTDGFALPLGECLHIWGFGKPRDYGIFTCSGARDARFDAATKETTAVEGMLRQHPSDIRGPPKLVDTVFSWAALNKSIAAAAAGKRVSITLGDSFAMADYTGTAITIRKGCSVSIISGASIVGEKTVLDAGSKGTLFIVEGSLTLEGLTLKNGLAKEGNGGALTIRNMFTSTSCSFVNNTAPGGDGGVAHVYRNASATFTSCSFINNTAHAGGGAVDVYLGAARFVACSFQESSAGTDLKYNGIWAGFDPTFEKERGSVIFGCPTGTTGADVPLKANANTSQLPPARTIVACHPTGEL
jgi:hypothetical protein